MSKDVTNKKYLNHKELINKKYINYKHHQEVNHHTQDTYTQEVVDSLRGVSSDKDSIHINSNTKPVSTPLSALDSLINYFSNTGTVSCKHFEEDILYKLLVDYTYNLDEITITATERRLITPTIGCINLWIVGKCNPIVIYTKGYPFKDIKVILPKN